MNQTKNVLTQCCQVPNMFVDQEPHQIDTSKEKFLNAKSFPQIL